MTLQKLTRIQKFKQVKANKDGKVLDFNYTCLYNISYNLYSFTISADVSQIIEQILPFSTRLYGNYKCSFKY